MIYWNLIMIMMQLISTDNHNNSLILKNKIHLISKTIRVWMIMNK